MATEMDTVNSLLSSGPICKVGCAPVCFTCRRRKAPLGRDVAAAQAGSLCDRDCPGYYGDPTPCNLWPGEAREELSTPPSQPTESATEKKEA